MSMRSTQSAARVLPLAAVLFLHFGSTAAAVPQGDIQQQMREVLSGNTATRAIPHSERASASAVHSNLDAQAFARRLLQGWSVFQVGRGRTQTQKFQAEVSRPSRTDEDFQSAVRRSLAGEYASSRGAL
jgi:hypothetical protein